MKADPTKFNRLIEEISIAAPITEEDVKSLLPVGSIVSLEKAAAIAGMSSMGMMPVAIRSMLDEFERHEAHLKKRLGTDFE